MKRKILYISMCLPFDKAFHAGGKTFNYYINSFANDDSNEVTLIAKVLPDEEKYIDTVNKRIKLFTVSAHKSGVKKYLAYAKSINSKFNPLYRYGNTLTYDIYTQIEKRLRKLEIEGYEPDIVILEWTQMLLFIDCVKKNFPRAKYVASEHDVTFLGKERRYRVAKGIWNKTIRGLSYKNMMSRELTAIDGCDLVVTHNQKDKKLLLDHGIDIKKLDVIAPYYEPLKSIIPSESARDIVFYGAMNRLENYSAALWFIDNVMPLLDNIDIRFVVVGNKPPIELQNRKNERVLVTGFVEDVSVYFEQAVCLVAPLFLGAGIKVKILEALTAGLVTLTNDIGIEGIGAVDGRDYIHCNTPDEYSRHIIELKNDIILRKKISGNARKLICQNYDLKKSFINYSNKIYRL